MVQVKTFTSLAGGDPFSVNYTDVLGGRTGSVGERPVVAPCDAVLRNLWIEVAIAPGAGKSWTYTLLVNSTPTAMTVTISGSATVGAFTASDIVIREGDRVSLKLAPTGTPTTSAWRWSIEHESVAPRLSAYTGRAEGGFTSGVPTQRTGVFSIRPFSTDAAARVQSIAAAAGTLTKVFYRIDTIAIAGSDTLTLHVWKNGTKQDGSGGTVDTGVVLTSASPYPGVTSFAFALPIAPGDQLYLEGVWTGVGASPTVDVSFQFTATTNGESQVCGTSQGVSTTGAAEYVSPVAFNHAWGAETGINRINGGVTDFGLKHLFVALTAAPGASKSHRFTLRKNATSPSGGQVVTISGSETTGQDTSGVLASVALADLISLEHLPAGTPAAAFASWGLIQVTATEEGGGEVPDGENPEPQEVPTTIPLVFGRLRLHDGSWLAFGERQLNDAPDWYSGKKVARLKDVSVVTRRLSKQGDFEDVRFTVNLADTDRLFRALVAATPLRNTFCEIYLVDDATRRAEGPAFRYAAGLVRAHRARPDWLYELDVQDPIGIKLADLNTEPRLPPDLLHVDTFAGMDRALEGRAAHWALGKVSDEDAGQIPDGWSPQGVVPALYLGQVNFLTYWGGIDQDADAYLLSQGAMASLVNLYYNAPSDPDSRTVVPGSSWGVDVWAPGKPGWSDTGTTGTNGWASRYIDFAGRRLFPLFVNRDHPLAQAARENKVLIAANLLAVEDVGDGTGAVIDSPARLWQWILVNQVLQRYTSGNYLNVPALDGTYSIIDTASVEAAVVAHAARISGGYVAGFLLGRDGQQQTWFDVATELCQGADMDQGVNRHGQLMLSVEDVTAAAVLTFDATDIEQSHYETWTDGDQLINRVEDRHAYMYLPPKAPVSTGAEGDPVPAKPFVPYPKWASGFSVGADSPSAQTAIGGEIKTLQLDNYVIRDHAVAADIDVEVLTRGLGPANDGPRMFRFTGGLNLLGSGYTVIELGSVINVTHRQRIGTTATGTDKNRVLAITVDGMRKRVTLEGRVLVQG